MFYLRLATTNVRAHLRIFAPFILACTALTIMNVIMISAMVSAPELFSQFGAATATTLFQLGAIIMAIFTVIFAWYANSFLLKQRTRQLALYNIIGFGKKELLRMVVAELLLCLSVIAIVGAVFGAAFARVGYLALRRILAIPQNVAFGTSPTAIGLALLIMVVIFISLILIDTIWIYRHQPLAMLQAVSAGEKQPRTNWLVLLIGILAIGVGYGIAITIKSPITAVGLFFIAVILVIIGTYALFTAGAVFIYKRLRAHKHYYYQPKHFINVANMIHRMRQNGAGLASIAVLVTMTLVTIATTVTLYLGVDQIVAATHTGDFSYITEIDKKANAATFKKFATKHHVRINSSSALRTYPALTLTWQNNHQMRWFKTSDESGLTGANDNVRLVVPMTLTDYNAVYNMNLKLSANKILFWDTAKKAPTNLTIAGTTLNIQAPAKPLKNVASQDTNKYTLLVFANHTAYKHLLQKTATASNLKNLLTATTTVTVNVTGTDKNQVALYRDLQKHSDIVGVNSMADSRAELMSLMGAFLFMGILLGFLFLIATALILYYKQVSEGLADAKRYEILQQVGLSHKEVKQTINSQLLTLFYVPLVVAACHTMVAAPFVQRILVLFGITNWQMYAGIIAATLTGFGIIYIFLYKTTASIYYHIVAHR